MFTKNVEFRVTIRDFQDRCEPEVLRSAGPVFLRAIREASADYLENCIDHDAELRWTVKLHEKLGVGTIHYVVYDSSQGFGGKCLVWDLAQEPKMPWAPLTFRPGELLSHFTLGAMEEREGIYQPDNQTFSSYLFRGWMPRPRISADMVEEESDYTLVGAGFSQRRVLYGTVLGNLVVPALFTQLDRLKGLHQRKVMDRLVAMPQPTDDSLTLLKAARTYEFDYRAVTKTLTMKVDYLAINEEDNSQEVLFTAIVQEGGWLEGTFIKDDTLIDFVDFAHYQPLAGEVTTQWNMV